MRRTRIGTGKPQILIHSRAAKLFDRGRAGGVAGRRRRESAHVRRAGKKIGQPKGEENLAAHEFPMKGEETYLQ